LAADNLVTELRRLLLTHGIQSPENRVMRVKQYIVIDEEDCENLLQKAFARRTTWGAAVAT
jgi:hypothetical protein